MMIESKNKLLSAWLKYFGHKDMAKYVLHETHTQTLKAITNLILRKIYIDDATNYMPTLEQFFTMGLL